MRRTVILEGEKVECDDYLGRCQKLLGAPASARELFSRLSLSSCNFPRACACYLDDSIIFGWVREAEGRRRGGGGGLATVFVWSYIHYIALDFPSSYNFRVGLHGTTVT